MTNITIDETVKLPSIHFSSLAEAVSILQEELLEQKLQYAKRNEKFVNF